MELMFWLALMLMDLPMVALNKEILLILNGLVVDQCLQLSLLLTLPTIPHPVLEIGNLPEPLAFHTKFVVSGNRL
jgi:hypothetical protein